MMVLKFDRLADGLSQVGALSWRAFFWRQSPPMFGFSLPRCLSTPESVMAYTHIDFTSFEDRTLRKVFRHADMYLRDAYGMFRALPPADGDGGVGNFSIILVLLCVIDGLATEVWPGSDQVKKPKQRFKKLIRCKLHWGTEGKEKWVDKGNAAVRLYAEFRNPLVHELGKDKSGTSHPEEYGEPVIGKWGNVPEDLRDIAKIDALEEWNDAWPILSLTKDGSGKPAYKLAAAGLYWAVKRLALDLAASCQSSLKKL